MRLLTHLGLDTGFSIEDDGFNEEVMGGGEIFTHLGTENGSLIDAVGMLDELPRILKSPDFCWLLDALLKKKWIDVEHVFLPVRDPLEAAQSRQRRNMWWWTDSHSIESQKTVHEAAIGATLATCVVHDINCTVLKYPDFTIYPSYCWDQLCEGLDELVLDVQYEHFEDVFERLTYTDKAMLN